jgi:hypothetical protein
MVTSGYGVLASGYPLPFLVRKIVTEKSVKKIITFINWQQDDTGECMILETVPITQTVDSCKILEF